MDVVYGSERTLEKFRVLELVARVPYQAWENVAYVAVTQTAREPGFARRVFDRVRINRWEQDNEQWHAEHEYALLVQEHPEWDTMVFDSNFTAEFGQYDSRADLFRQIGYDERLHKLQSEATMTSPRFS